MKIKTNTITGLALDWAVKKALGDIGIIVVRDGKWLAHKNGEHRYSSDWSQGGPIIEREGISVSFRAPGAWGASNYSDDSYGVSETGPTPLIAAMRCVVASKLGDEVDIPEELS